ncbi:MAG: hypothetical protein SWE60_09575 [Thermodesulfobacteriota bacterium]|nr:hypothetical protein [Thermodesulfobacteriota bacterium]
MEEKLVEMMPLENGLTLEFYDASKHVAGDRWLVSMVARIEVDPKPEYFTGQDSADLLLDDITAAIGEKTVYRYEKIRNFIPETEKDDVFKGLKQRFLDANLRYLSSPEFPGKLILKKYQEAHGRSVQWKG